MIHRLKMYLGAIVRKKTEYVNYGRKLITEWSESYINESSSDNIRILDIGFDECYDFINIKETITNIKLELFGADLDKRIVEIGRKEGILVFDMNIENEPIPVADEFFDIIIANQILEHTKEIFYILSEICRTLKEGGLLIIGVPNLAALHNRILLLLGEQPSCIEINGPHVRGFTAPDFKRFIETKDYFEVREVRGCNFYPFPPVVSKPLARMFPTFAVTCYFKIIRLAKRGNFMEVLCRGRNWESQYFMGDGPG
jgi:SAM-dependent methyltransferase